MRNILAVLTILLALTSTTGAKENDAHPGVIAASAGKHVVLAAPDGSWTRSFETGTVGWLYPAPGGALFAPDVISGRTTVIDTRGLRVAEVLEGVTLPSFGPSPDRYVVAAGDVLMVSHPERAIMARIAAGIENPWQVVVATEVVVLILERTPDGVGGTRMTAVDLANRQIVYQKPLPGDIRHFALSRELRLLALADAASGVVRLVEPATLLPAVNLRTDGTPIDVGFAGEGNVVVAAVAGEGGPGSVVLWSIKTSKKKGFKIKEQRSIPLAGMPVRLAVSPAGDRVAVALEGGSIAIIDEREGELLQLIELGGSPRDAVWCDPSLEGPELADWSEDEKPDLDLDKVNRR